jgi:mono/diheme cytochrome c family protein
MRHGLSILWLAAAAAQAASPLLPPAAVANTLKRHCLSCHSTEKQKGELDLEGAELRRHPQVWEQVLEQIELGEMPPKKEPQPTTKERRELITWVRSSLDQLALEQAGDPGPVLLRRLSNAEYTYSLRDITGLPSLDPAREFPIDGAAGEGFSNQGAALVMSPALLDKYLEAAKQVAAHAVFTPRGLRWSNSTSARDWTDELLAEIRAFYDRHSGQGEGNITVAQGIKLDTGTGSGRLPLEAYLKALQGKGKKETLSAKYLDLLDRALHSGPPSLLLDPLRKKFKAGQLAATDVELWQQVLWRFANVGHIGKQNGPKAWQEPVNPIAQRHEMRLKLDGSKDNLLYLCSSNAGDGQVGDEVIWENPRLVAAGRPDLPLAQLPQLTTYLEGKRAEIILHSEACLNAIAANRSDADAQLLSAWRNFLGLGGTELQPLLGKKMQGTPDYNFIKGWQGDQAMSVLANSSDSSVRTPGLMKAHGIAAHPSPTRAVLLAWRCPSPMSLRIEGDLSDAHPECGNGVTWALELRRGHSSEVLAKGVTKGATLVKLGPFENVNLQAGQVLALVIGPRDGNHACDLTAVNLRLQHGTRRWDLAADVSPDILKGNPHGPWHFLSQPAELDAAPDLPAPIAAWRRSPSPELARAVRRHLEQDFPLNSALLRPFLKAWPASQSAQQIKARAPQVLEIKIPSALAKDAEFVVSGRLANPGEGSVQMQVLSQRPASGIELLPGQSSNAIKNGQWSDNNLRTEHSVPVLVNAGSQAEQRFLKAFDEFRALFPIALCYQRIVPVDEVVTLTLFYREDEALRRLILSNEESRRLDELWQDLLFVSEAPLKQVDVFEQLFQFATQDAKPSAFEPLRQPILEAAERFKQQRLQAVAAQKQAVLALAPRLWRRALTPEQQQDLLRFEPRLMLVRLLTSPHFLYRGERAAEQTAPLPNEALASRLSYFLWSSAPDEELLKANLQDQGILAAQATRLLKDPRVQRLALEFGCQYLQVRDVASLEEKSERHFPEFGGLREAMQEEVMRFWQDLITRNQSVLSLLEADHSFVNPALAKFYGLKPKTADWQRVEGMHALGRGGVLGFAATLARHSGASRSSAILRGTWVTEVLLGEKLPAPPKGVPVLPEQPPEGLSERELIERHSRDANCAGCHRRIDPYGYALEGFDAIGRARQAKTQSVLPDGAQISGMPALREHLLTKRRDDFARQLCRKLLGYALGRSVQLSDKPLLDAMVGSDLKFGSLIEAIVTSRQFRQIRGRKVLAQ